MDKSPYNKELPGKGRQDGRHKGTATVRGFTLLELLIAIAIVATLAGIALPNFRELSLRMNATQTANALIADLNYARAEATRRGIAVKVASASNDANWSDGWAVIASNASTGAFDANAALKTAAAAPADFKVCGSATAATAPAGDEAIVFNPMGALASASGMTLQVNPPSASTGWSVRIHISASGAISSSRGTTSSR